MYVCMYVCVCVCVYVCMHVCMCVYVCMYVCMFTCTYILCMYLCMYLSICSFFSKDFSCYEPDMTQLSSDWKILGHLGQDNHDPMGSAVYAFRSCDDDSDTPALTRPTSFRRIWDDSYHSHVEDASIWRPTCKAGVYVRPLVRKLACLTRNGFCRTGYDVDRAMVTITYVYNNNYYATVLHLEQP